MPAPATILVARHGDAAYETKHWADEGGSLTETGRAQARGLAERLRDRRVAHVWTSTYARAVQTAEIAASHLGVSVTTREGLREFGVGRFRGSRAEDPFAEVYGAWLAGDLDRRLPGGETGAELRLRIHHALHEIALSHPGETVLAVSHGGADAPGPAADPHRRAGGPSGAARQLRGRRDPQRRPGLDCLRWPPEATCDASATASDRDGSGPAAGRG